MALRIFNTRTRQKEEFLPPASGPVLMYVCGVTTYDDCHLGHARAAVAFDVIVRHLRTHHKVKFVRNITDIDDKIINRAQEQGMAWDALAQKYTDRMHEDFSRLGILPPDHEPKATEHLDSMFRIIKALIARGIAYESHGDVFFSVRKFASYGSLSGKNIEDLQSGARVEIDEKKADPLDFALWKAAKPGEPTWESPWGPGRPGWHIECSAMSWKLLGETIDIHGGGRDLIFPHHENEIAQSECASGKAFVRYWLHNGFVTINKEKMSKSLKNFFTIREVFKKFHPERDVVRLFLLSSHYRGPIDYAPEYLEEARGKLDRVYQFKARAARLATKGGAVEEVPLEIRDAIQNLQGNVREAMDDDFNTVAALAAIFELVRGVNTFLDQQATGHGQIATQAAREITAASQVLGLFQMTGEAWLQRPVQDDAGLDATQIDALIAARNAARVAKNWQESDRIRDELLAKNIVLEDTPQGTVWRLKA